MNAALLNHVSIKVLAKDIFQGTNVKITTDGHKHLGAALGSPDYRDRYISKKVADWNQELMTLSKIAETVPHAAYCALVQGVRNKWLYIMRTIPNISHLFQPLEDTIRNILIPAMIGIKVNDVERKLLTLPPKYGGLGITNPTEIAQVEFENSLKITHQQQEFVINQTASAQLDQALYRKAKNEIKQARTALHEKKVEEVKGSLSQEKLRLLETTQEKGSSNWLNCLPLKDEGYNLNKLEFRDSIKMRYGWQLENLPATCPCGNTYSIHHATSCKLGGFVHMRHNEIRDITAKLLEEVCNDVRIEPPLQPIRGEQMRYGSSNRSDEARLDVSARGFWNRGQRAFFDVRVFDSTAPRTLEKPLKSLHQLHEQEKRRAYNQRVLQIEQGSFTPLVFTTMGGQSYECDRFYNRLSAMLAEKRGEAKSQTTTYIRCKINFSLLKSALLCIRGTRRPKEEWNTNSSSDLTNTLAGLN